MSTYDLESAKGGRTVVPGTTFSKCRAIWVGTAGDVNVMFASGKTAIYKNVSGRLDVEAIMVVVSGTTASDMTTME